MNIRTAPWDDGYDLEGEEEGEGEEEEEEEEEEEDRMKPTTETQCPTLLRKVARVILCATLHSLQPLVTIDTV